MKYWILILMFVPIYVFGQVLPFGSVWKYYDLEMAPPGDSVALNWTGILYNDIDWQDGAAQLGYGDGDEVTEINNNTLTGYFRYTWEDTTVLDYPTIRLSLFYDDGAVIYINGEEVWRVNMPAGAVLYNTFASANSGDNETARIVITNPLLSGVNTIGVEVHQRSAGSSDLSFDFSVEYIDPSDTIVDFLSEWKYYDLEQAPPDDGNGNAWTAPMFDDLSWASGYGQLGYGDSDEATILNSSTLTTYFRKEFITGELAGLSISLLYDDGAVIYLDGEEILRINMPGGVIQYGTLSSGASSDNSLLSNVIPMDLAAGLHVLTVEVHQTSATSSDISFDLSVVGLETISLQVIRGPYLQKGSDGRMTICWRTLIPSMTGLRYGTVPGLLPYLLEDTTMTIDHSIEITGLSPGTKYYYTISVDSVDLFAPAEDRYFKTSPLPGSVSTIRGWILGDCGTGDNNARAVRDAYYDFIGDEHTDFILLLGDNAYTDGTDADYQTAIFENMYEQKLMNTQLWACLGNHDGHSASSASQTGPYYDIFTFPTNAECGGEPSGTEAYYSFDYGNVHIIVLDSYDSDRSIDGPMYTWCEDDIQNTLAKWIIAFWHHPAYTKGSHDSDEETALIEMRSYFLPMLEANGVDLVLSGHSHSYERSFYLNGHYGLSATFDSLDNTVGGSGYGDGRLDGDGAYLRLFTGPLAEEGAVYITAGSSGKTSAGALDHPAMYYSDAALGSCYLEITNNELSLSFIRETGEVDDYFTIRKADEECTPGNSCDDGNPCTVDDVFTAGCFCEGVYQTLKTVMTDEDSGPGSLRDLVANACDGDTLLFDESILTPVVLQSQIAINKDLTIIGNSSINVLSGDSQNRIFLLETGSTLHLQNLTLTEGSAVADGGAILVEGVLEIDAVDFVNNFDDGMPRAITNHGLVRVQGTVSTMKE